MNEYHQVMTNLRQSYNQEQAEQRDKREPEAWKRTVRQQFLTLLQQEGKTTLLEIGAGTGQDSLFFQNNGLQVVCTDLSADMVHRCCAKGLVAYVMDFLSLDFPAHSFDAVYALNCLHHVPTRDLLIVLHALWRLLRPGGLFSLCVYGGMEWEGVREQDWYQLPRFFASHTDEHMCHITAPLFDLVSFHTLPSEMHPLYFQCLILRAKQERDPTEAGEEKMNTVSVETLRTWLEEHRDVLVLDVRPSTDYQEWAIPGSLHVDAYDALKRHDPEALSDLMLPTDRSIVTVCGVGKTSQIAAQQLAARGLQVSSLEGGMKAWSLAWNTAEIVPPLGSVRVIQVRRTGKGCLSYLIGNGETALVIFPR